MKTAIVDVKGFGNRPLSVDSCHMYSDTAGEHDGLLEEPLLERVALPRAQRASGKPRRKRPPVGLGSKSSDAANNENDFGESSDGEHLGFEQLDQAQVVGTEMPVLPPILTSLSAPLISTSVPDVPLDAPETGDTRRLQLLAASEAPRRPNPWEHSNKKTFKPIITIGKQSGSALAAVKKRQLFSLPFAQQRRLPAQAPEPRVTASPPLFATEGIVSFRCGTLCVGAALDVREVFTHYSRKGLQCTACGARRLTPLVRRACLRTACAHCADLPSRCCCVSSLC